MPKIFKPGHIVQFENHTHASNVDGFVVVDSDIAACIKDKYGFDGLQVIGLNDGQAYTMLESNTAHCQRVKGKVKVKGEYPKQYLDEDEKVSICGSASPPQGKYDCTWSCEREAGHPGDHMAWEEYPHTFYKGGVWPQEAKGASKVKIAMAVEPEPEIVDDDAEFEADSTEIIDDENPF